MHTSSASQRKKADLVIECTCENRIEEARILASHLGRPLVATAEKGKQKAVWSETLPTDSPLLVLRVGETGLSLTDGTMELKADFSSLISRLQRNKLSNELLVRAAKLKNAPDAPLAIDATAGLGEDSLLLAAAGFTVRLYEYNPIIAALLKDALKRAASDPRLSATVSRMAVFEKDSVQALRNMAEPPAIVLLDPMFPERRKSALVKKKFQIIHRLEWPCESEEALLDAALAAHPRKIIVKRPLRGPYLAGRKPDYSLTGKAIRYDCLQLPDCGTANRKNQPKT